MVIKKRYSAFYGTNLDKVLDTLNPDAMILAGINTHACIRMTAIDAYQRDWEVVAGGPIVNSYDPEHHDVSLRYMKENIASSSLIRRSGRLLQQVESALRALSGKSCVKRLPGSVTTTARSS